MTEAVRFTVMGRVQGVGYRAWAVREARKRGLRGWVRNRLDGSVDVLVIGEEPKIADMAAVCRKGPMLAEVEDIAISPALDDGSLDFTERPTG
ncbi:MAG: acylphosphatase [Stellaceae bacterium]